MGTSNIQHPTSNIQSRAAWQKIHPVVDWGCMSTPASLAARDAQHHLHPFTNHEEMHAAGTHVIVRGEGAYLWDARGHKMLDGLAGLWCVNVGYSCHEITEAV